MIVKKFQAETETEAILKAKDELGSGAVVLNVKTLKQRGVFRLSRSLVYLKKQELILPGKHPRSCIRRKMSGR